MKRRFPLVFFVVLLFSCGKQEPSGLSSREVAFRVAESPEFVETGTKASVVTGENLSTFYVSATKGTAGSETQVWNSVRFTNGGSGLFMAGDGGKYWPYEDAGWHFYASNIPLFFDASGCKVTASTDTDVVCASLPAPSFGEVNTLRFDHVFSRIGSFTVEAEDEYTISNVSVVLTPKVLGTLDLSSGAWSNTANGSDVNLVNAVPGTKSNDVWLLPGMYSLLVSWRASLGSYQEDFVDHLASVTLEAGKVYSFSTVLGGNGSLLDITVTVLPWDSTELDDPIGKEGGYWV